MYIMKIIYMSTKNGKIKEHFSNWEKAETNKWMYFINVLKNNPSQNQKYITRSQQCNSLWEKNNNKCILT